MKRIHENKSLKLSRPQQDQRASVLNVDAGGLEFRLQLRVFSAGIQDHSSRMQSDERLPQARSNRRHHIQRHRIHHSRDL